MKISIWNKNYKELCSLINNAWESNYPNFANYYYDETFLKWFLEDINGENHSYAVYENKKIIAFAGLSRGNYKFKNKIISGYFCSLFCCDPKYNESIASSYLLSKMVLLLKEKHIKNMKDLPLICFHISNSKKNIKFFKNIAKYNSIYFNSISITYFKIKAINLKRLQNICNLKKYELFFLKMFEFKDKNYTNDNSFCMYNQIYLNDCYSLYNSDIKKIDFCTLWTKGQFQHQLQHKNLLNTILYIEKKRAIGFINYRIISIARNKIVEKIAILEWISTGKLSNIQKKRLFETVLIKLEKEKCVAVMYQNIPFIKKQIPKNIIFLPYLRKLKLGTYSHYPINELRNIKNSYEIII